MTATVGALSSAKSGTLAPAILTILFGLFLIWGVGFSNIASIHNAAHDVRHSSGFPCH
jgi:cobalt transporter subunit CbtB